MSDPVPTDPQASPAPRSSSTLSGKFLGVALVIVAGLGIGIYVLTHSGGPIRDTCRQFITQTHANNFDAVKPLLTEEVDVPALQREMARMKDWGDIRSITLPAISTKTLPDGKTRADVAGQLEYGKLSKMFQATLIEQPDGSYRIASFRFD